MSPVGGPPNGNLVAPNKFAKKIKDQSRPFVWGYRNSVWRSSDWGHSESARNNFYKNGLFCYPLYMEEDRKGKIPPISQHYRSNIRIRIGLSSLRHFGSENATENAHLWPKLTKQAGWFWARKCFACRIRYSNCISNFRWGRESHGTSSPQIFRGGNAGSS